MAMARIHKQSSKINKFLYYLFQKYSASERAQLIDDSFQLALNNQLNYSTPLGLIGYLSNEVNNSIPWYVMARNLDYVQNMLSGINQTAFDLLKVSFHSLFQLFLLCLLYESPQNKPPVNFRLQ